MAGPLFKSRRRPCTTFVSLCYRCEINIHFSLRLHCIVIHYTNKKFTADKHNKQNSRVRAADNSSRRKDTEGHSRSLVLTLPRTVSYYTLCSEKNTHSHFLSYLHELFVDLNKNCSEYTQGLVDSNNVKIRYSLRSMT